MRTTFGVAAAILALVLIGHAPPAQAGPGKIYAVFGVEEDDMLKLRAGPGIGYKIIAGLPNGTLLRVHKCEQTGGTRWCRVSLKQAPGLKGYVSWAYLRED